PRHPVRSGSRPAYSLARRPALPAHGSGSSKPHPPMYNRLASLAQYSSRDLSSGFSSRHKRKLLPDCRDHLPPSLLFPLPFFNDQTSPASLRIGLMLKIGWIGLTEPVGH